MRKGPAWVHDKFVGRATKAWPAKPLLNYPLKFTMVYLADFSKPGDINNFVKPVQDALCALIYADDSMNLDVSAHMRFLSESNPTSGLPSPLAQAIMDGQACVYVAVSDSSALVEALK